MCSREALRASTTSLGMRVAVLVILAIGALVACSPKKTADDVENESRPADDEIAQDCVAFLRATKLVPPADSPSECPGCASASTAVEAVTFQGFNLNHIACSESTCEVRVAIIGAFNPGTGTVVDGLAGWISPEQRAAYLRGAAPSGSQSFAIKITYKRADAAWRAVEFERAE